MSNVDVFGVHKKENEYRRICPCQLNDFVCQEREKKTQPQSNPVSMTKF